MKIGNFGGTVNAVSSHQKLRVPGWSSTGAAQAPLPDDRTVELSVGLGYYGLLYSHNSYINGLLGSYGNINMIPTPLYPTQSMCMRALLVVLWLSV